MVSQRAKGSVEDGYGVPNRPKLAKEVEQFLRGNVVAISTSVFALCATTTSSVSTAIVPCNPTEYIVPKILDEQSSTVNS